MRNFTITSKNHQTLYQGKTETMVQTIENALADNVDLRGADLTHIDLTNLNIDGANLSDIDFTGSNLSGANLSETSLSQCNLSDASLFNTCLAYSIIDQCHFMNTQFGATDIIGAQLSRSVFSGLSSFTLDLHRAANRTNCVYLIPNTETYLPLDPAPIIVHGLHDLPLVIFEKHLLLGHEAKDK